MYAIRSYYAVEVVSLSNWSINDNSDEAVSAFSNNSGFASSIISSPASATRTSFASSISFTLSLAAYKYWTTSALSYVSQNSRLAVPWSNLRTLCGSLIPGSSTSTRPAFSSFWTFGWVTPKRSIRVRKILNALSIALCDSVLITFNTSSLESYNFV